MLLTTTIIEIAAAVGFTLWGILILIQAWRSQRDRPKTPEYLCTTKMIKLSSTFVLIILFLSVFLAMKYVETQTQAKSIEMYQHIINATAK